MAYACNFSFSSPLLFTFDLPPPKNNRLESVDRCFMPTPRDVADLFCFSAPPAETRPPRRCFLIRAAARQLMLPRRATCHERACAPRVAARRADAPARATEDADKQRDRGGAD